MTTEIPKLGCVNYDQERREPPTDIAAYIDWLLRGGQFDNSHREPQPAHEPVAHSVVAGALFDFMGWLTTRNERLILSATDYASPAVEVIEEFAKMRGLTLYGALVLDWQKMTALEQLDDEPVAELFISGIIDDEYGEWEITPCTGKIDALQEKIIKGSDPVKVPLYTRPQPADEPVAYSYTSRVTGRQTFNIHPKPPHLDSDSWDIKPLYTKPQPARELVGLTEEEISAIAKKLFGFTYDAGADRPFARAIEAKLKELNT